MTKGPVNRILVESMLESLQRNRLNDLLPIGYVVAGWFLKDQDITWLRKEYLSMFEMFHESPVLQWMEDDAREMVVAAMEKKHKMEMAAKLKQLEAEKKAEFRPAGQKFEFSFTPTVFHFTAPLHFWEMCVPDATPNLLTHAPPVPPPKPFLG